MLTLLIYILNVICTQNPIVTEAILTLMPLYLIKESHPFTLTPEFPRPIVTKPNSFGLFHHWPTQLTIDPESTFSLNYVYDTLTLSQATNFYSPSQILGLVVQRIVSFYF